MTLFPERALSPENIGLPSGPVRVSKFSWQFPLGDRPTHKFGDGKKPTVVWEGQSIYAELALISILKTNGFTEAVWRDNFGKGCFREAMPKASCGMPESFREVTGRILAVHGSWDGCWDVLAMGAEGLMFVECRRKKKDGIKPSQEQWLESGLKAGLSLDNFAICEWTLKA
jgi:hypothetical protein